MEPDLSSTITMHPHPFHLQQHHDSSASRSSSRRPATPAHKISENGTSTAIEAMSDEATELQAVSRHTSAVNTDVESQAVGRSRFIGPDPYNLTSALKTDEQIEEIKANSSRKRQSNTTPNVTKINRGCVPFARSAHQARKVQGFYRNQNETINRLLKPVEEHRAEARQEQGEDRLKHQIAVWGSFLANIILAVLQIYGAVSSGSLSLFTTMADAIFDPMSNITLILTNRAVSRVDPSRFPSGKARLETVGNISFCFIMTSVSLILIAFSARELVVGGEGVNDFHFPSVIAVCTAFGTKLVLFLYCWGLKDKYSQINILWQDHRNDLIINGFGILTSVGGSKLVWWIDPMGAILISVLISFIWLRTAFAEFLLLVGVVANVETQQLITYVCLTHSPAVLGIDTVRVYHSGPRLIAEVDIVMDPEASLRDTHDVAEELQFKLEDLPDIERAYVHVDYETTHKPEHAYKKDI